MQLRETGQPVHGDSFRHESKLLTLAACCQLSESRVSRRPRGLLRGQRKILRSLRVGNLEQLLGRSEILDQQHIVPTLPVDQFVNHMPGEQDAVAAWW